MNSQMEGTGRDIDLPYLLRVLQSSCALMFSPAQEVSEFTPFCVLAVPLRTASFHRHDQLNHWPLTLF